MNKIEQDPKRLSDRIGKTTLIIDALKERIDAGYSTNLALHLGTAPHQIPSGFTDIVMKATHAVLIQSRAIDAVMLARAAGVPTAVDGADEVTIVVQATRALHSGDEND